MYSILLAIGLFTLTFLSPGPNLLVVVQSSMAAGRRAGVAASLGVATGDGLYAALGLFGMSAAIARGGALFAAIEVLGGAYLLWYALRLLRDGKPLELDGTVADDPMPLAQFFRRGLITDLANAQTVLFFASIFSMTLTAHTPMWAKVATWLGIVTASIVWRLLLSHAFSRAIVRRGYARIQRTLERLVGVALGVFGARLVYEGLTRR
ncbi:MAG TPA: homoserine/threonine efflux transporter [Casimicrobiaceae bacterium]|jgi:amino acid exporter